MSPYWPGERFGGACTCTLGPNTTRAVDTVASRSSKSGSGWSRIAVSGFARKFWTMTSCRCPYRRCTSRSANRVSTRSGNLSPIPNSSPDVKGTESRPASSRVRSRTSGSLSGELKCASPLASSRSEVVSSMIPMDGATCFNVASWDQLITPGLRCGSNPVPSITCTATARRYSSVVA
jgi:hypothetical protein